MVADGCGLQQKRKADRSIHVMRRERSRVLILSILLFSHIPGTDLSFSLTGAVRIISVEPRL